jgi:putative hydrolase of the HAD superfamily
MSSNPVLVLDIDGVVSVPASSWLQDLAADWGIAPDAMAADFFRGEFLQVIQGRLDLYVALHNYLAPMGKADRMEALVDYWFTKDSGIDREVLAMADAWRQRTGGKVFAATNQEHHRAAYLRNQLGLDRHFDEIIYSAALGVCKPERVFFTNAQARMGVTAAQAILFVDDNADNVDGARMAGWRAMLYRGRASLAPALEKWG